jgi:hypothetical protein
MTKCLAALALLAVLPSCVAAIGNSGTWGSMPKAATPFLQEKVSSAERIVSIRERALGSIRSLFESGRADADALAAAEVAVEEARIQLAQFRAELESAKAAREKD